MDLFDALSELMNSQPRDPLIDDTVRAEMEKSIEQQKALHDALPVLQYDIIGPSIPEQLEKLSDQVAEYNAKQSAYHAADDAERRKDARKNRRDVYLAAIISGVSSVVLTLIVEHFSEIVAFIRSLF